MIRNMFFGAAKSSKYRPEEILYDVDGAPAAVVIGSYASDGMEPWNIRGRRIWIAVGLAAVRGVDLQWCVKASSTASTCIVNVPNLPTASTENCNLATSNTGPDVSGGTVVSTQSTEAHMDECFNKSFNSNTIVTSELQTDTILAYNNSMAAAQYCRAIELADLGKMDLPSIDVLMRIYQARTIIDAIDTTAAANASKKLSSWGFSSNSRFVWSAMQRTKETVWVVYNNGALSNSYKYQKIGIIPVKEIEAE